MKKSLLFFVLCVFFGISVSAQDVFFPTKEGVVLGYKTYDKKGKETGGSRITIKTVKGVPGNLSITYQIESLDPKEAVVFLDNITITQKGDVMYFDMGNFVNKAAFQQNGQIPAEVKITGNSMETPVNALAGTTLPDANMTMEMKMGFLNMKMTANLTNRKVGGWEDLTTKAGSFNSCKFTADVAATILGMNLKSKSAEWYAKGVGIVKSESYDKKGDLESRMELVEFKK